MTITDEQGTNKNKWIWIGLGAAVLFCCCAILAALLTFRQVGKKLEEGTKTDPESAAKAAHEIVDYDLPRGYQEQMAMDVMIYSFVMIAPDLTNTGDAGPLIMLAQFKASADPEQVQKQIQQSFEQQSGNRGANMKLVEVKKKTIRGQGTNVAIYEGTTQDGIKMRQLVTVFPGKNGTAMLMIMGDTLTWDQDMVNDFIDSIR